MSQATRRAVRAFKRRVMAYVDARKEAYDGAVVELSAEAKERVMARRREACAIWCAIEQIRGDL
jgi:hypothetical protein